MMLINMLWWHPYAIVGFNQLFGGAPAGAATFAVGWGEGFDQVAEWLNQQPDSTGVLTISRMITSLNPYLDSGVQAFFPSEGTLRDNAGYVVVYISEVQGGPPLPPSDQFYGKAVPVHQVVLHGVPYAWMYHVAPAVMHQRDATFGDGLQLYGFDVLADAAPGQTLWLKLIWYPTSTSTTDYWLFAHLIGSDGTRYAQVDQPYPTTQWQPGRYTPMELPIDLPADLPAGTYQLLIGLYDPTSGQRLPLNPSPAAPRNPSPPAPLPQGERGVTALSLFDVVVE
ncbi:MAG: hypothetical protein HC837_18290 [Chloroflexaceae bacterium]|nr:hypothetical protein [Chloroflexaceae bacterium]